MADQGDLREALAATIRGELPANQGFGERLWEDWADEIADAVLALLSDRGWVSEGERLDAYERGVKDQDALMAATVADNNAAWEMHVGELRTALHSLVEGLERVGWWCKWSGIHVSHDMSQCGTTHEPVYRLSAGASAVLEAEKE